MKTSARLALLTVASLSPSHDSVCGLRGWNLAHYPQIPDPLSSSSLQGVWGHAGTTQAALAKEAIKAICLARAKHHSLLLSNTDLDGNTRHTQFEMWPARVRPLFDSHLNRTSGP